MSQPARMTPQVQEAMLDMRGEGRTIRFIATWFGLTISPVEKLMAHGREAGDWRASGPAAKPPMPEVDEPVELNPRLVASLMARGLSLAAARETAAVHAGTRR